MARTLMIMAAEREWWRYSSVVFRRWVAREQMGSGEDLLHQPPWWFVSLAVLGAVCLGSAALRLLAHLVLLLRRPTDLRRRYGAWAVVTGPTSGIGRSVALELARRGLNLVLVGRDPAKLRDVSDAISAAHAVQIKTVEFDFSLVGTVEGDEALLRLRKTVDGVDVGVLVNNAGVATPFAVYLHEADVEAWVHMVRVNMLALTEVTAAVLPGMVERGRGAVVNIGSGAAKALPSYPLNSVYSASKRYIDQFSRSLYVEYKSKGIDVQGQVPMFVETKMTSDIAICQGLLSRLMVVLTPDVFAPAAVNRIGHHPVCIPCLSHQLQYWCVCLLPDRLLNAVWLHLNLHQRALIQRLPRTNNNMSARQES